MESKPKITTGLNDRPRNESIAQTAPGLPDDTGHPVDISDEEIERTRAKLMAGDRHAVPSGGAAVGDEDPDYSPMENDPSEAARSTARRLKEDQKNMQKGAP